MVHGDLVIADYGPNFLGWAGRTAERIVCVTAPRFEQDLAVRSAMRELVKREGGDCAQCGNCLIGRLN